jgi:hypothetical protein
MRVAGILGRVRVFARRFVSIGVLAVLAGCVTVEGGPDRLYSVADEKAQARGLLEGSNEIPGLTRRYYAVDVTESDRRFYRNEIIARRMYIVDIEYSTYEAALTSERQKFGFATSVVGQGLTTAGALVTPAGTTRILSGVAGAVNATRGFYDSELVIAKTLQIVIGQMRAQRDLIAQRILLRREESTITYPVSAALTDLEDYYLAGTFNTGLLKAAGEAGEAARNASQQRTLVTQGSFSPDDSTRRLVAWAAPNGTENPARMAILRECLAALGYPARPGNYISSSAFAGVRALMIQCALGKNQKL